MKLKKTIIISLFIIVITIGAILIINKIQTTPKPHIPSVPSSRLMEEELVFSAPFEESGATEATSTSVKAEYPKQVIVSLKDWGNLESAKKIIIDNGGQIINVLNWPTKIAIIASLPDRNAEEGILKNSFWGKLLNGIGFSNFGNKLSGGVDSVEEDIEIYPHLQISNWALTVNKIDTIWNTSNVKGAGVKVAILDTGIQRDHPDLQDNIKGGINFTIDIASGKVDSNKWDDDQGHGTSMAGIIAAKDNTIGTVGVAPEADLYIVKVLSGTSSRGSMSAVISGIYWAADNGMDIINMSFGGQGTNEELNAINYANQKGAVLVASSGNDGLIVNSGVGFPAAYPAVIAVGSIGPSQAVSNFSSHGPEVDLVAPGEGILSTAIGSTYNVSMGSSDASPFVAGVAALLLSKHPEWNSEQVRDSFISTAIDLGEPGKDDYYGYGRVNVIDAIGGRSPAMIFLHSPQGGEQWLRGVRHEINWSTVNLSGEDRVDIKLINQENGAIFTIANNIFNTGSILLTIPSDQPESDKYAIEISCGNYFGGECVPERSGTISIKEPPPLQSLQVVYPRGGEIWPSSSLKTVFWNANYLGGARVNIDLLETKQMPNYRLVSQDDDWNNAENIMAASADLITVKDTCDGNLGEEVGNGIFVCPVTSPSGTFSCRDIAKTKFYSNIYWAYTVTCNYKDVGTEVPAAYVLKSDKRSYLNPQSTTLSALYPLADLVGWLYNDASQNKNIFDANAVSVLDTCHGNYELWNTTGPFKCPATYQAEHLRCIDVFRAAPWPSTGNPRWWEAYVDCDYTPAQINAVQPITKDLLVATLAGNIINKGYATIGVPNDLSGNNYKIKISCNNFNGECSEGISGAPFSIVALSNPRILTINKSGIGSVTDGDITCGIDRGSCSELYERGTVITLSADTSDPKLTFTGWSGACAGKGECQVTMDSDKSVTATFSNRFVTLTAIPTDEDSVFSGWTGECVDNGKCTTSWSEQCVSSTKCNITLDSDQTVCPIFNSLVLSAPTNTSLIYEQYGLKLSWNPPISNGGSPIVGYKVERYISDGEINCASLSPSIISHSEFLPNLTSGTNNIIDNINYERKKCYAYSIRAINQAGIVSPPATIDNRNIMITENIRGPFRINGSGFKAPMQVRIHDSAIPPHYLNCYGWEVEDEHTIINGSCIIPDDTPVGLWNVVITAPNGQMAILEKGFSVVPPKTDAAPASVGFYPATASIQNDKIHIESVTGKNIVGGALIKLKNKFGQQIDCFNISQLVGYNADGTAVYNGGDCDTSNVDFEISSNSQWQLVVENSSKTNKLAGSSSGLLSTTCDPILNCVGKECGSNGCGGWCNNNPTAMSCTKNEYFGICNGVGTKTCTNGKYGDCVVLPSADPRLKTCSGKECGSDGCGGLCQDGSITAACTKLNYFGTCSAIGEKTCANGVYGDCQITELDPRTKNCVGKECGSNGCGGFCSDGQSVKDQSVKQCMTKIGTCDANGVHACLPNFTYTDTCIVADQDNPHIKNCSGDGRECGPDGCGGICGVCPVNKPFCNSSGKCVLSN